MGADCMHAPRSACFPAPPTLAARAPVPQPGFRCRRGEPQLREDFRRAPAAFARESFFEARLAFGFVFAFAFRGLAFPAAGRLLGRGATGASSSSTNHPNMVAAARAVSRESVVFAVTEKKPPVTSAVTSSCTDTPI